MRWVGGRCFIILVVDEGAGAFGVEGVAYPQGDLVLYQRRNRFGVEDFGTLLSQLQPWRRTDRLGSAWLRV